MTRLRRFLLGPFVILLAVIGGGYLWVRTAQVTTDGSIEVAGIGGTVTIARDTDGVPRITAGSERDAFFGLGFVHAQDRLWQMDFRRRLGSGRLAEIIGEKARASVAAVSDYVQSIYREAQLALRAVVGTKTLDTLLEERDAVADELRGLVAPRLEAIGLELVNLGIRDVILPGDMKVLLNKVIEAQKAAEANLITRREETAAIRSQLNAARILESNPTLMRLRELEALEKVTEKANLTVVLGDGGLADKVVKLL